MLSNEPIAVDTSPEFKIEVIRQIGFLKRHKAARPDGLSASFFKNSGEVLKSGLKLMGSMRAK